MRTHLASARVASEFARVGLDVQRLEELWERVGDVSLADFWRECATPANERLREADAVRLGALIKADLRRRFERGESLPVARYLEHFPELRAFDSRVVSLVYEEFCLREEGGECLDVSSFCARYPEWKDSLASQLQYHRLLSQAAGLTPAPVAYPEVGEYFEEFELLAMIGKGGSSRVYLASDRSLGGKRVVLKVSLDRGQEPKTLGALDHPHIVPVNSVVFQGETRLRGLSMPFRPGLPLDEIVKRLPESAKERKARDLWLALVRGLASGELPLSEEQRAVLERDGPSGDGWDGFPVNESFARGAAWTAMILARTLEYAHRMRTFHRDVKPGNVLLTLGHGPQLLDFNLAESPHSATHAESALLGGTLPYMAPEQIEAFLNPELWGKVGARSDVYSLGLVLRELLTGIAPDLPDEKLPPARAMRELLDRRVCLVTDVGQTNPEVPHALRAIIDQSLKLDPDRRYPDAGALAVDLERFLTRGPLATAVNPSRRERTVNWLIRNRRNLGTGILAALVGLLGGTLLSLFVAPLLVVKPDPAKREIMVQAAKALKEGRAHQAVPLLNRLKEEYPDHPLPRSILAIASALSSSLFDNEAQREMRSGIEHGAEGVLRSWGREHPELPMQIDRYINVQTEFLNELKTRKNLQVAGKEPGDRQGRRGDEVNDEQVERRFRETWLALARIGLNIDPGYRPLRIRLANLDESFGRMASAYRDWTELLGSLPTPNDRLGCRNQLDAYSSRNRIAVAWSRELLGTNKAEDARQAGELLTRALEDLSKGDLLVSYLGRDLHRGTEAQGDLDQVILNHDWIGAEVCLSVGRLREEQGRREGAEDAYKKAIAYFRKLEIHVNSYNKTVPPSFYELERRVMTRNGRQRAASR